MKNQSNEIKAFILKQLDAHPKDIVAFTSAHFNVSRTTVHRHINALVKQGLVAKSGATAQIHYFKHNNLNQKHLYPTGHQLNEFDVYQKDIQPLISPFKKHVQDIIHYGFTEIFNNAIDHAKGKKITVTTQLNQNRFMITIEDDGMGIFLNIAQFLKLDDLAESVLQLSKGKLTTDPVNHTGEGLFFTARAFDVFEIYSNGIHYYRDNQEQDWGLERHDMKVKGTKVCMMLNTQTTRHLISIFKQYQDASSLAFCQTEILVALSRLGHETLISRSQAKRVLSGLEQFKLVTLDFSGVRLIGQGFVDEVFRVFAQGHPHIQLKYINANEDVTFMIKRSM